MPTLPPRRSVVNDNPWRTAAAYSGLPVFPIKIVWQPAERRWNKIPLTRHGHKDASTDVARFEWSRANGYGIAMGGGLYALDVDAYKEGGVDAPKAWLLERGLRNVATRVHRTVSGGWHLIFALPDEHRDLPSRADIVPGLDARGAGGWIAFGEGYELYDDSEPALLPPAVCAEIKAGHSAIVLEDEALAYAGPARPDRMHVRWRLALAKMHLLRHRAFGVKTRGDLSRSAADHSVAFCLALQGWREQEIAWALLEVFQHGACQDADKPERVRVRAAMRCAAKAVIAAKAGAEALNAMRQSLAGADDEFLNSLGAE